MVAIENGPCEDHDCMEFRERRQAEGGDLIHEWCSYCGRVRHETDGVRPMAWYCDPTNPTGFRYAYVPHRNDPDRPTVWRHPTAPAGAPAREEDGHG